MKRTWRPWKLVGWFKLLPALVVLQTVGCLPQDGFKQVVGENMLLTSAVIIQTLTSLFFNSLFGFI